ncbi:MAG: alpha-glucosidase/alpha-galactosidase [Opitutales bacterium]|nr:alpha-glucosidase/alpha-galactosidase [Opitutales bacterium]
MKKSTASSKPASSGRVPKPAGHAAHTRDANALSLPGEFQRPIKITVTGAGSAFTPRLLNDVVKTPHHRGGTLALVDTDASRLRVMKKIITALCAQSGNGAAWKVVASTDRRDVLKDSDYLINTIEVSGPACVHFDNDIPLKYGIDQCIGDTIGPGGLFKGLRTIPVWLDILRDCEELCPQALILNYTNPMAMLCLASARTSSMPVVGLCHSVQGTSHLLAKYADVPYDELEWACAGINHLAWFTKLRHKGQDLYPQLHDKFRREIAAALKETADGQGPHDARDPRRTGEPLPYKQEDLIRKDMCVHFGAFITESSGHLSEYLPYYRKSAEGRKLLRLGYDGGSRFYATNWPTWREQADAQRRALLCGEVPMDWERSWEYAAWIIEAREKNSPFRFHGNVPNSTPGGGGQLITNLPADSCVEVACLVDGNGVQPTRHGALPPQMAGVCASNLSMFDCAAEAAIHRSVETAIHALYLDPYCAAVLTPAQIRAMALEMFAAQKDYLPGFS